MPDNSARWQRTSLAALALYAAAGSAAAQTCGGEVDRLARQYDLSTDVPRAGTTEAPAVPSTPAAGSGATTTERRAQSSGILSPSDTGAPTAIRPPRSSNDRDQPAPEVPATDQGEAGRLPAAERARMTALLQAAQAAEREGNEERCLEHLRDAQAVPGGPAK